MRFDLSTVLWACLTIACSASENANHSIRCDSNAQCPSQQVCYREFCIPDNAPPVDVAADASVVDGESLPHDGGPRQTPDIVGPAEPLDAGAAEDAAQGTTQDAAQGTIPDSTPDAEAGPVVTTPPDMPTTPPMMEPMTPVVPDAGSPVPDAGRTVNSSALLVCVPSCANRSPACWFCLNGILDNNPGICDPGSRADPVSSGLCDFLCAGESCRGGQ